MKILTVVLGILFFTGAAWAGDFTDNLDGTVTDNLTRRMWQQAVPPEDNTSRNWESAISYCEALSLATYTDWRLPNIKELESITDDNRYNPSLDYTVFFNTVISDYWSSTTYPLYTSYGYVAEFFNSRVTAMPKTNLRYVRCVRGQ